MGGCPLLLPGGNTNTDPVAFTNASAVRGGLLYDKWWSVTGAAAPTTDHPLWASRPDTTSNARTDKDTWRCKECHGWDYKGVNGAYGSGSHRTGIAGIFGTTKTAQEVFDVIKTNHGFGAAGLTDADIWDLAKFVKTELIDTDPFIAADKSFTGDAANGQTLYTSGISGGLGCAVYHGADGKTINFGEPPDEEFVADVANGNPWEFLHKVRFGQPGTQMPSSVASGGTTQNAADVGAHVQTLP